MARIRQTISGSIGASENSIVFFPSGGHSHSGQNSSLIDTNVYSVYDFSPTFVGTDINRDRAIKQENNRIAFEELIKRVVNSSILEPAGIRLEPGAFNGNIIRANTITANEISANTITADELVSNIILVNNIIQSNNYSSGNSGWIISNTGSAEFNNVTVRGTVAATSGNIAGWTINTSNITGGSTILYSNGAATFGNTTVFSNGRITNGDFTVSASGTLSATSASISGTITSNSGTIGGWTINTSNITGGSTVLYSNGYINFSTGVISNSVTIGATAASTVVSNAATGASDPAGRINAGATTISGGKIRTGSVDSTNFNWNGTDTYSTAGTRLDLDGGQFVSKNFRIDSSGNVSFAGSGSFSGSVTAGSGSIGGWDITSTRLQKDVNVGGTNYTTFISPTSGIFQYGIYDDSYAEAYIYPGAFSVYAYGARTSITGSSITTDTITAPNYFGTFKGTFDGGAVTSSAGITGRSLSTTNSGNINADGDFFRTATNNIGTANGAAAWWVNAQTGGFLRKAAPSSIRYKEQISDINMDLLDPMRLLSVGVKQFKYKNECLSEDDSFLNKYLIGFIAEDMFDKYPIGATVDEEGRPEAWNYLTIIPAMMHLIQELYKKIEILENGV